MKDLIWWCHQPWFESNDGATSIDIYANIQTQIQKDHKSKTVLQERVCKHKPAKKQLQNWTNQEQTAIDSLSYSRASDFIKRTQTFTILGGLIRSWWTLNKASVLPENYKKPWATGSIGAFPLRGTTRLGTVQNGTAHFGPVCVSTAD